MSSQNHEKMYDLKGGQSCKSDATALGLHDPIEHVDLYGFSAINGEKDVRPMHDGGSCNIPEFVSPSKLAELLDCAPSTITRRCQSGKFKGAQKTLIDGNESWQIPITSLPPHAREKLGVEAKAAIVARAMAIAPLPLVAQDRSLTPAESRAMFEAYENAGRAHEERTEKAFSIVRMFTDLVEQGYSKGDAEKAVMASYDVSRPTVSRYRAATNGHPVSEWMPRLSPNFKGGRPLAEFTEAAYEYIYGAYLNTSKTPLTVVLIQARSLALEKGWVIPGDDAVRARLAKEPRWAHILGREGPKALEQSQPPVRRDYTDVAVNEIWCSDGHRLDLFCRWPDGTVERLFMIFWCDTRSRLVLGVKVYSNPTAQGVLSAFGMAMQRTGYAPNEAKIDNGMEYAAKSVTGGQANRYRNKVVPFEPIGLLTHVGTKAIWSKPGRGQDKQIESFWNFIIANFVKLPEFEGAYCGKDTASKPEGFDPKKCAIPVAMVQAKLAQVLHYFNTQHRHRGSGMDGRTPQEVYEALFDPATRTRVDPMHIEMCNHGVAQIKPDRSSVYTLSIPGYGVHRYWSEAIAGLPAASLDHKHDIWYDLDDPKKPIVVHDGKKLLGRAACFDDIPYREISGEASGAHLKLKNARMKPQKDAVRQIKERAKLTPIALPAAPVGDVFSTMPVTIEAKRSPPVIAALEYDDPWEDTDTPGLQRHRDTGRTRFDKFAAAIAPTAKKIALAVDDATEKVLERLRQADERKRLRAQA